MQGRKEPLYREREREIIRNNQTKKANGEGKSVKKERERTYNVQTKRQMLMEKASLLNREHLYVERTNKKANK